MIFNLFKTTTIIDDIIEIKNLKNTLDTSRVVIEELRNNLVQNKKEYDVLNNKLLKIKIRNKDISSEIANFKSKEKELIYDENELFEDLKYIIDFLLIKQKEKQISNEVAIISHKKNLVIKNINLEISNISKNDPLDNINCRNSSYNNSSSIYLNFLKSPSMLRILSITTIKVLEKKINLINKIVEELRGELIKMNDSLRLTDQAINQEQSFLKYLSEEKINLDTNIKMNMVSIDLYSVLYGAINSQSLDILKLYLEDAFKNNPILEKNLKIKRLYFDICKELN